MTVAQDDLLTVREAAKILNLARVTVRRWIRQDTIKILRLVNGDIRIRRSEVEKLIKKED